MIATSTGSVSKREWRYCAPCQSSWRGKHPCPKCGGRGVKRTAYEYSLIVDGKRERKQFPTRAEAQSALDARKEEVLQHPKPVENAPKLTLGEALDRCLALKVRKRAKTLEEYRRQATHLKAVLGADTLLAAITADTITAYKAKRLGTARTIGKGESAIARPLSIAAVQRPLALLRQALRLGRKLKVLAEVPDIEMEREPGRLRWLTPEEAGRLLAACQASKNPDLADVVELALFTGLRQSEALGLTWNRVDRAQGVLRLEETKNGERRTVPLNARTDAVLARRWTEGATGYVFGSQKWDAFRTAWEAAVARAGLTDFRFHDLRHTIGAWLTQKGRTLREVQEVLGHKTIAMTQRYTHLAPAHLRATVAVLDDVLSLPPAPVAARHLDATIAPLPQGGRKESVEAPTAL